MDDILHGGSFAEVDEVTTMKTVIIRTDVSPDVML